MVREILNLVILVSQLGARRIPDNLKAQVKGSYHIMISILQVIISSIAVMEIIRR